MAQPIDGGTPRELAGLPGDEGTPIDFAWSADGQRLALARAQGSTDILLFRGLQGLGP